jgi:hypothetical protein
MRTHVIGSLMIATGLVFLATAAQAQVFVFPEKGQSPEQQEQDEFSCHKWAKEQTGIDPNAPAQTAAAPPPPQGGAARGAAKGAAAGAIGGAIAGDAGKGAAIGAGVGAAGGAARKRRGEREYQQAQQQATAQQQQKQQTFDRAYRTCLEGRGYKVG